MVTPASIAVGSALAAGAILKATQEEALLAGPEYIRDAQPEGITRRVGLGLARAACQRYANNPGAVNADRATSFENACRPYLDSLNGGEGPSISKPFNGGQCAVLYNGVCNGTVNIISCSTGAVTFTGAVSQAFGGILGPIQSLELVGTTPGACGTTRSEIRGIDGNGNLFSIEGLAGTSNLGNRAEYSGVTFTLSRQDGQPDNCGNPAPVVDPPRVPTVPFPIPIPIVLSPDVNIETNVEINIDGSITFDIGTGPITVDPFGDNSDGGDTGGGGADDSPPAPEPGPELPGGNGGFGGDDPFGEPPAGRRWVGACITITNRTDAPGVVSFTVPEDVYTGVVGNIRLVYDAAGTRQTDTPVRIQAKKVCVWEGVRKLNPVAVSVDLLPGYGYSYRPYSVPLDA